MFRAFRNLLHLVLGEAGGTLLRDFVRGELKPGAGALAERIREVIRTNPRAALVVTLISMAPGDRVNLMKAREEAVLDGNENRFTRELGEMLPKTPEGKIDKELAKQVLKELNDVPEDELKVFLEFLNHDPIAEWFRYWVLGKGKEVVVQASEVLAELAGLGIRFIQNEVPEAARKVDHWAENTAAPAVERFNQWLDRKGVR